MKLQNCHSGDIAATRRLLAAAASAVSGVRCLHGRWSGVSATIARLSAAVDDLAAAPNFAGNPLTGELLASLNETLNQTLALADCCRVADPPAGKLRTQSDVSAAGASLDRLADDADLILRSDALKDAAFSGVGASPELISGRETIKASTCGLVARLQIGGPVARLAALDSLLAILCEDDKNVVVAAAQGAIPAVLRLLDSGAGGNAGREVREKVATAIARFSTVESCRQVLASEGSAVLSQLARILESECGSAREQACIALQTLTLTRDGAVSIGSLGCIDALVEICVVGTPSAQAGAAGVLKNLAVFQELRHKFLDEDAVPVLIRVLASGTCLAQENVIGCLRNLSDGEKNENLKLVIFKEGALEGIKNYLEGGSDESRNVEHAIGLLRNLGSFRYIAEIIASTGFLSWIIAALDSKRLEARTEAAKTVAEFGTMMGKTRKEFGEALPLLVQMLEAKMAEENEAAAMALSSLLSFVGFRKLFKREENGIANVVQLLDPLVRDVDKKHVISILVLLSHSRKCRKQMIESGACKFLQRLATVDVDGAKRLLEILEKGKIWGVFPRT